MLSWFRRKPKPTSLCEEDFINITIPASNVPPGILKESPTDPVMSIFVARSVMAEPEPPKIPTVEDMTKHESGLEIVHEPTDQLGSETIPAHESGLEGEPVIEGDVVPSLIHQESTGSVVCHDVDVNKDAEVIDDVVGDYEWKYDSSDDWSPYQKAPVEEKVAIEIPDDIVSDDDLTEEDLADSLDAFIQRLINLSDSVDKRSSRNSCDIAEIARSCSESISAITLAISNRIRDITGQVTEEKHV